MIANSVTSGADELISYSQKVEITKSNPKCNNNIPVGLLTYHYFVMVTILNYAVFINNFIFHSH